MSPGRPPATPPSRHGRRLRSRRDGRAAPARRHGRHARLPRPRRFLSSAPDGQVERRGDTPTAPYVFAGTHITRADLLRGYEAKPFSANIYWNAFAPRRPPVRHGDDTLLDACRRPRRPRRSRSAPQPWGRARERAPAAFCRGAKGLHPPALVRLPRRTRARPRRRHRRARQSRSPRRRADLHAQPARRARPRPVALSTRWTARC